METREDSLLLGKVTVERLHKKLGKLQGQTAQQGAKDFQIEEKVISCGRYFYERIRESNKGMYLMYFSFYALLIRKYLKSNPFVIASSDVNFGSNFWKPDHKLYFLFDDNFGLPHHTIEEITAYTSSEIKETMRYRDYDYQHLEAQYSGALHELNEYGFYCEGVSQDDGSLKDVDFCLNIGNCLESNRVTVQIRYNRAKFDLLFTKGFMNSLDALFSEREDEMSTVFCDLEPLLGAERKKLLQFNDDNGPGKTKDTLVSLFQKRVEASPDQIAIIYRDRQVTLAEVNRRVNGLVHCLMHTHDIRKGDLIGVVMAKSDSLITVLLAILKSGAVYVPVSKDYPENRINYLFRDTSAKLIIADQDLMDENAEWLSHFEVISGEEHYYRNDVESAPSVSPIDSAYVIYTSGSTGHPKGVMINHEGITNRIKWMWETFGIDDSCVVLHKTPYIFDVSVWEIFGPVCLAGVQIIVPKTLNYDPVKLGAAIKRHKISDTHFIPSLYAAFLQVQPENFDALKRVFCSGEELLLEIVAKHYQVSKSRLINLYGPTEASIDVSYFETSQENNKVPIGKPISNIRLYILNKYKKKVPIGMTGEIYISGIGLAIGYLNDIEKTVDVFCKTEIDGNLLRIYKTGDLGRWNEKGEIEFLGREDDQIKVRGQRIELGEINSTIMKHPGIELACTLLHKRKDSDLLITFYSGPEEVPSDNLHVLARKELTKAMVPYDFFWEKVLPKTASGKVDKRALAEKIENTIIQGQGTPPENERQEKLLDIWKLVLGLDYLGIDDDFFLIGGDSIKAIPLVYQTNIQFELTLEVKDLFSNRTVRDLFKYIQSNGTHTGTLTSEIDEVAAFQARITQNSDELSQLPKTIEAMYPMSDIEKGMIFYSLLHPQSGQYHLQFIYQFDDPTFSLKLFRRAFALLLSKHEALRTSFFLNFEEPIHAIHFSEAVPLEDKIVYQDLRALTFQEQRSTIEQYKKEELESGFDLSLPGIWLIKIFQIKETEYSVIFSFHHSILDGWSYTLLTSEWTQAYFNLKYDLSYTVDELDCSYKDYIVQLLHAKRNEYSHEFWRTYLSGYSRTPLPWQKPKIRRGDKGSSHTILLHSDLVSSVERLAESSGNNLKSIYLAAIQHLLKATTNSEDVTVGLVTHFRPVASDGDKLIGCFLNTVPIRSKIEYQSTPLQAFIKMDQSLRLIKQHDHLPLNEIVKAVQDNPGDDNPFFDIIINYNDYYSLENTHSEFKPAEKITTDYILGNTYLDIHVNKSNRGVELSLFFPESLFDKEELFRIQQYLIQILKNYTSRPDFPMAIIDIMPASEKKQLIKGFNETFIDLPDCNSIHTLFEWQAAKFPDAIAITSSEVSLTYRVLNEQSNQLAHSLMMDHELTIESIVGIQLYRTENLLIAILGIMKAGMAYLPIDPKFPYKRVRGMLEQSDCNLIISEYSLLESITQELKCAVIDIDNFPGDLPRHNPPAISPNNLAYVMFTSGSTGRPKGVMIEHSSAINFLFSMQKQLGISALDKLLAFTTYAFDISVLELILPLTCGAQVVLADNNEIENIDLLVQKFKKETPQFFQATPSLLRLLVDFGWDGSPTLNLLCGGEKLEEGLGAELLMRCQNLWNMYGPTETTIWSISKSIKNRDDLKYIGKPILNTEIYFLSDTGEVMPLGVMAEIGISGSGLGRGYINDPELTNERFMPQQELQKRIYRTGDLGRWSQDGNIEFAGRNDNQVKVRGNRVELGEIERVMAKSEYVNEVVVVINTENVAQMVAYYSGVRTFLVEEWQSMLKEELPDYMIPQYFIELDKFPLTVNGKIDRKALMVMPLERSVNEFIAPTTPLEESLLDIWKEILFLDEISTTDNFFRIGGESLAAMNMMSSINRRFQISLVVGDFFSHPDIRSQAILIEQYLAGRLETIAEN